MTVFEEDFLDWSLAFGFIIIIIVLPEITDEQLAEIISYVSDYMN
jgi:hypothetical protein